MIDNTSAIKWMRKRMKQSVISSSLTSLLLEKEKCKPFFLHILERTNLISTFAQGNDNVLNIQNKIHLKPQMFFNQTVLNKVYQICDIFLEFDVDWSRTLEISELLKMFNSKNIPITQEEMISLFSTGKKKKIE